MNWRAFLSGMIALVILSSPAYASLVSEHSVVADIDENDVAHFNASLVYLELDTEMVSYLVFAPISSPRAWDSQGDLDCTVDKQTYGTQISCLPNVDDIDNYTVSFSFDVPSSVRKSGASDLFSYSYGIKVPTQNYYFRVLLPVGASLMSSEDFDPYYPEGATIGTELGRRVSLEWSFDNPDLGRTYSFDAYFEFVGKPPVPPDGDGAETDYFMILAYLFGAGFIIFAVYSIALKKREIKGHEDGVKRVFSVLKGDERRVIDVIIARGNKCRQRDIVKDTDFSKAKVSRIMVELEERGIITRERTGRTNRIILNENVDIKKPAKDKENKDKI